MHVTLKRSSWHYKLHTWVLGEPEFNSLCPYFWLTVFCTFAAPFKALYSAAKFLLLKAEKMAKFLIEVGFYIGTHVLKILDRFVFVPLENYVLAPLDKYLMKYFMSEQYIVELSKKANEYNGGMYNIKYDARSAKKFNAWKSLNTDWETLLAKYTGDVELAKEKKADRLRQRELGESQSLILQEQKKAARRKLLIAIAENTKVVFYMVCVFVAAGLWLGFVWLLEHFFMFISDHISFIAYIFTVVLTAILYVSAAAFIAYIAFCIGGAIHRKFNSSAGENLKNFIGGVVYAVLEFFVERILEPSEKSIGRIVSRIAGLVKLIKSSYCPAIEWEE